MLRFYPAPPRGGDAKDILRQVLWIMRVGVDRQADAHLHGAAGIDVIQIETVGVGVDFQRHAAGRGCG